MTIKSKLKATAIILAGVSIAFWGISIVTFSVAMPSVSVNPDWKLSKATLALVDTTQEVTTTLGHLKA